MTASAPFTPSKHPRGAGGKFTFSQGASGQEVQSIQKRVGASQSGTFDESTKQAVMAFQRQNGLQVDGVVGAQTVAAMRGRADAATVTPGAMSGADRAWLLKQLVAGTTAMGTRAARASKGTKGTRTRKASTSRTRKPKSHP